MTNLLMQSFVVITGENLIDRDLNRSFSRVPNLSTFHNSSPTLSPIRYVFACAIRHSTHPINWQYHYFSFSIQHFQV